MLEPALAFGTGTHESTRLALLALEPVVPLVESMVDVGTGSGVLSIGAKLLKPSLAITALDKDVLSVSTASENLSKNQVGGIRLFVGEPIALKSSFDLVVANLTLEIFKQLAGDLIRLSPAHLILSGFTVQQTDSVLYLFRGRCTLEVAKSWRENDWMCVHLSDEKAVGRQN
jgi:ribosomal protein L11 methyltransferase